MKPIVSYLTNARLARKQVFKNLTLFPLLGPDAIAPDYWVLEKAMAIRQLYDETIRRNAEITHSQYAVYAAEFLFKSPSRQAPSV